MTAPQGTPITQSPSNQPTAPKKSSNDSNLMIGQGKGTGKFSYFAILFYLLLTAMTVRQKTVLSKSKQLKLNAEIQNSLNVENGKLKFKQLPESAKQATINSVQDTNEEIAAVRADIQNQLITTRQGAQVTMTQTTTDVNLLEQDASENSGWIKTLNTTFKVIDGITKNSI